MKSVIVWTTAGVFINAMIPIHEAGQSLGCQALSPDGPGDSRAGQLAGKQQQQAGLTFPRRSLLGDSRLPPSCKASSHTARATHEPARVGRAAKTDDVLPKKHTVAMPTAKIYANTRDRVPTRGIHTARRRGTEYQRRGGGGEESGGVGRTGACTYAARRFDKTWKGPQLSASQQQRALHTTYMYTHTHNTTSHVGVPIYHVCLERQHFVRVCVFWLGIVARPQKSAHWRLRTPLHPSVTRPPSRHAIQLTADTQLSVVEWS